MAYIRFKGKKKLAAAQVSPVSGSVVRISTQDNPVLTGFQLYLDADGKYPMDSGEYAAYTTLYRQGEGWYELSNDGSTYQEPEETEETEETAEELTGEEQAELDRQARIAEISSQVAALKAQIEATDYQVIKTYEYALVGLDPEYDIMALHQERQGIREQINRLQSCIDDLLQPTGFPAAEDENME